MSDTTVRDVHEFLNQLPESARDVSWGEVLRLFSESQLYRQFCVKQCNAPLQSWEKRRFEACEDWIVRSAVTLGCVGVEFDEDPNGGCVFLVLPSGRTNDMAHQGWIVPDIGGKE